MEQNEYLIFNIDNENKFKDFKKIYYQIKDFRERGVAVDKAYWLKNIPDYCKEYYIESKKNKGWDLISVIEYLQVDLEIGFLELETESSIIGKLNYEAFSYPYGGVLSIISFLKSLFFIQHLLIGLSKV